MDLYIVAEISKSWTLESDGKKFIGQQFENVINTNHQRGYGLVEWKFTSIIKDGIQQETIIAIFKLYETVEES